MAATQPSGQHVTPSVHELKHEGDGDGGVVLVTAAAAGDGSPDTITQPPVQIPLRLKIIAVLLVSAIGFGGHWSSGVTGAMKSTLKKVPWAPTNSGRSKRSCPIGVRSDEETTD